MLVVGGINSERAGINNIIFNDFYCGVVATECEEQKNKMQPLWTQFLQWKTP